MEKIFGFILTFGFQAFFLLIGLGDLYWLWIAVKLGSFSMFLAGLFPLFVLATGPLGAWSLIFGTPQWIINIFG